MQTHHILSLAGDTLTDKKLTVKINLRNFQETFNISRISVGNRYRISSISEKLRGDIIPNENITPMEIWKAIYKHTDDLLYATGICIQNREKEPSAKLLHKLKWLQDPGNKFLEILTKSLSIKGIKEFYEIYRLDKRPKCTECAGADPDCERCSGTGLKPDEPDENKNNSESPWGLLGSYRKYWPGTSRKELLWETSWLNFMMDLATIPSSEPLGKEKVDEEMHVAPEDERAQLKKDLGL